MLCLLETIIVKLCTLTLRRPLRVVWRTASCRCTLSSSFRDESWERVNRKVLCWSMPHSSDSFLTGQYTPGPRMESTRIPMLVLSFTTASDAAVWSMSHSNCCSSRNTFSSLIIAPVTKCCLPPVSSTASPSNAVSRNAPPSRWSSPKQATMFKHTMLCTHSSAIALYSRQLDLYSSIAVTCF